ncbi:MAG: aminopeptidase P family protein, partial [Dehalococcoidia bacterium]
GPSGEGRTAPHNTEQWFWTWTWALRKLVSRDVESRMDRQEEVKVKLQMVRTWLKGVGLEAVVLSSVANFAWLTGGANNYIYVGDAAGEASLLVTPHGAYLLTNNIEAPRLREEEVVGLPFEPVTWNWYQIERAQETVARRCNVSKAVSDVGSFGLPLAPDGFRELRYTMLPPEIERYLRLGLEAAQAVETACFKAQPGDTELEVAASLAFQCQKRGILPLVNLVAGDERIARYRHPLPTSKEIRHTMMVALTGRRHGLHISLTRMVSFGPPNSVLAARHRAVATVDARLNLESRAGVSLGEVMGEGMAQYSSEGFPQEWELHHQGGLTGYAGREIFATPSSNIS